MSGSSVALSEQPPLLLVRLLLHILQCRQRLVRHIPLPQNLVDHARRKPCPNQPPHDPRGLLFVLRLLQPPAPQVLPPQSPLIGLAIARFQRLGNQLAIPALLLQIVPPPPLAQLLILLAQPRIGLGKGNIVQVAVLLEPLHGRRNSRLAQFPRLHTLLHQPPQLSLRAHLPPQRPHAILVQPAFIQECARLRGFALERQLLAPGS